jgi:hypothetical protein
VPALDELRKYPRSSGRRSLRAGSDIASRFTPPDASQTVISAAGRESVATRCNPLETDTVACTLREARVDRASGHRNPKAFLYAAMHLRNAHRPSCGVKDADDCALDDPVAQSTLDHAGRFARSPSDADRAAHSGPKGS